MIGRNLGRRILALVLADSIGVLVLYSLGILVIETLFVLGNVSLMIAIVLWEKDAAWRGAILDEELSVDDRWSKTKARIEWIEKRASRNSSVKDAAALQQEKSRLTNELRRLEWSIKESELGSISLASMGKMGVKRVDGARNLPIREAVTEKKGMKALDRMIREAIDVLRQEPIESFPITLSAIQNTVAASYKQIKRMDQNSGVLVDYWVVWVVISSLVSKQQFDEKFVGYASGQTRVKVNRLIETARARGVIA